MSHPLIDALPGFPVKISAVLPSLDKAWADEGEEAARASQMNLVLMFGAGVSPEDAQARFDEAIRFARQWDADAQAVRLASLYRSLVRAPVAAPERQTVAASR